MPNNLGLTDQDVINEEEAAGFLRTKETAVDQLDTDTQFSLQYLYGLHREALGCLYDFAGRLRTVDMSKGGFMFAPAQFLPQTIEVFEQQYLDPLNAGMWDTDTLLNHLAAMHAELLYIHPFREGNGRIVRLFTELIWFAKTGEELDFDFINEGNNFERYIAAVQQAANNEHGPMQELFREART